MKQRKKVWSICLVIALVFSSIFTWNEPAKTAYASETKKEKIVVYVATEGKSSDGTKTVAIDKTPVQVDAGTDALTAVKPVLEANGYNYNEKEGTGSYTVSGSNDSANIASIDGMKMEEGTDGNWSYWAFYVNGELSNFYMGGYTLQDGDEISMIYSYTYKPFDEADVFTDDAALNPETAAIESAEVSMKQAQAIAAKEVYKNDFADGHIPGLGNVNELYVVFSLARAGFEAPEFYGKVKYKLTRQLKELATEGTTYDAVTKTHITEETFSSKKVSEQSFAYVVLAMTALGMDARTTGGYDLIEKMASKKLYEADKSNNAEQMMLSAFDSGNYKLPEGDNYCTREELAAKIVENVEAGIIAPNKDGAVAADKKYGFLALVDDAVMAVQPLAAYTEDASVQKACQKVIRFAGKMQNAKGYYGDSDASNNAETAAQVLTMLGEFGINPLVETENVDFVKNGHTLADAILEYIDLDQGKMTEGVIQFSPVQVLHGITSFVYTAENAGETLYRVKTIPAAKEITEPFEEEKPQPDPSAAPSAAPSASPSAAPAASPSASPSVAPSVSPSSAPNVTPSDSTNKPAAKKNPAKKNPAKKIVAAKKKVNVKKGKTAKIVIKVTANNPKQATTDTVKVSGKKIKVKKITKKAGKITIKVKALKKGKRILKIKVGKASTKVTLNVR